MKRLHSDNRGLTLVELIVVVAILGILTIGSLSVMGMMQSASAKETTTKLQTALNKARTEAMSKSQASLKLYEEDSAYYVQFTINNTEEAPIKIGNSRVRIFYTDNAGTTREISSGNGGAGISVENAVVEFKRETGGFKPIAGSNNYYKKFTVTSSTRSYDLVCQKLTGKIVIE